MSPSVDSQTDFTYVQPEVHLNAAESISTIPAPDLNISHDSIDSYMREIGDSHFISHINPSLPFDQPCCSYDTIPEYSIPSKFNIAPTQSRYTSFINLTYSPISHTQSPISSESSLTPPVGSDVFPTATQVTCTQIEPVCVVCKLACSDAHRCPGCHQSIHIICGNSVENMEGYGCPVWCKSCLLEERSKTIEEGRRAAKRGQGKQINRMIHQSNKRIKLFNIGENVLLPIPEVDKRSPFDPQNIPGVVLSSTVDGFYQIGTSAGRLENHYTAGQFEPSLSFFLTHEDVPDKNVTLRAAILHSSLGSHKQFCNCTSGCLSNKCKCRKLRRTCTSKCHKALTCHNKSP